MRRLEKGKKMFGMLQPRTIFGTEAKPQANGPVAKQPNIPISPNSIKRPKKVRPEPGEEGSRLNNQQKRSHEGHAGQPVKKPAQTSSPKPNPSEPATRSEG